MPKEASINETPIKTIPISGELNNCTNPQTNNMILVIDNARPAIPMPKDIPKAARITPKTVDKSPPAIGKIIGLKNTTAMMAITKKALLFSLRTATFE